MISFFASAAGAPETTALLMIAAFCVTGLILAVVGGFNGRS